MDQKEFMEYRRWLRNPYLLESHIREVLGKELSTTQRCIIEIDKRTPREDIDYYKEVFPIPIEELPYLNPDLCKYIDIPERDTKPIEYTEEFLKTRHAFRTDIDINEIIILREDFNLTWREIESALNCNKDTARNRYNEWKKSMLI